MPMHVNGTTWDLLVTENALSEFAKQRGKDATEVIVPNKEVDNYLESGWTIKKQLKTKSYMIKQKPIGDSFEDELWTVFYKMGFKVMNANNDFAIAYDERFPRLSKQIDIVAIDDETCIFVECKEAALDGTRGNFSQDIQEIANLKGKLYHEISKRY